MPERFIICKICGLGLTKYSCKSCGIPVCESCYDKETGLCITCKQARTR